MKNLPNIKAKSLLLVFVLSFISVISVDAQIAPSCIDKSDKTAQRNLPPFIYGITLESANNDANRNKMIEYIKKLCVNNQKPFVRIVFQSTVSAPQYEKAVNELREVAFLVGSILDSQAVSKFSVKDYEKRTLEFWELFKNKIDIWEIGNEINGQWLRPTDFNEYEKIKKADSRRAERILRRERQDVLDKISKAFDVINDNGGRTALTLFYNDDGKGRSCLAFSEDSMIRWVQTVPQELKDKLDYVWVSYYDDPGCMDGCRYDENSEDGVFDDIKLQPDWKTTFEMLGETFKNQNLKLGFGEIGTRLPEWKNDSIVRYYDGELARQINHPKFVGGYFWWYFESDVLSARREELIKTMRESIEKSMKP